MIEKFYDIGKKLFPLNRSITGKDTLKTLKIISKNFKILKLKVLNLELRYLIGKFILNGM